MNQNITSNEFLVQFNDENYEYIQQIIKFRTSSKQLIIFIISLHLKVIT